MEKKISCIAALDIGTTAVKVCLFSPRLSLLACSTQEYALNKQNGFVETRPEQYTNAICAGLAEILKTRANLCIKAIGITTQGETFAPVNKEGLALHPFIVWLDSRAETQAKALAGQFPRQQFYRTTGLPELTGTLPLAKLAWLRENEPGTFAAAYKFLLLEDYLLYWLTGNFVSEKSLQTSTGWFNLATDGYWAEGLKAAGAVPGQLPRLLECGEIAGALLPCRAKQLNLEAGIPVVAGAMDQTAAALAAGCLQPGTVTETTGTALVMAACTDAPTFAENHHVTIYRHAIKGKYLYLPIGNTAGMALRWFRDEFCRDLLSGTAGYAALDKMASEVEPGCGGLVFLPYLAGSIDPHNCPEAKACFFGATLCTTRAHFIRSIIEATAFMLRDFLAMLRQLGCPVQTVYSLGGGAASPFWQQVKADVCGQNFTVPACNEASAAGAALLAGWGSGLIPQGHLPKAAQPPTLYKPTLSAATAYENAYRLYQQLYAAVNPLFKSP